MNQIINYLLAVPVALAQTAQDIPEKTTGQLENLVSFIVVQIPVWIAGVIVIALTFVIAKVIQNSVENKLSRSGFEEEHKEMQVVIGRVVHVGVIILGVTVGLKIAGLDLTPIIAAGAFGAGFALQDMITNFLAGVMILSSKHFTIGDNIKVNGIIGKIVEIQTRATIVKNFDGTKVIVPNAELFKNPVTSLTSNPFRKVQIAVGVEYGTDLKTAMDACLKAAKESLNVLIEPKPSVWLYEFGASSINMKVNAWIESRKGIVKTKTNLVVNIKKELDAVGIGIPFPIRTIIFDEDDRKRKEASARGGVKEGMSNLSEEQKIDMVVATGAVPVKSAINPENFDAPDWMKKAAAPVMQPAPALVTIQVEQPAVQPADSNPLFFTPTAFASSAPVAVAQQVAAPAPVAEVQPFIGPLPAAALAPASDAAPVAVATPVPVLAAAGPQEAAPQQQVPPQA
jgi:small-conductance mechanosensitive channel